MVWYHLYFQSSGGGMVSPLLFSVPAVLWYHLYFSEFRQCYGITFTFQCSGSAMVSPLLFSVPAVVWYHLYFQSSGGGMVSPLLPEFRRWYTYPSGGIVLSYFPKFRWWYSIPAAVYGITFTFQSSGGGILSAHGYPF